MSKKVHSQKKIFRGAYNDGSDDVAGMPSDFIKHESLKLTVIYFFASLCWILLTDSLSLWLFRDNPYNIVTLSVIKGIIFITVSSAVIYGLVYRSIVRLLQKEHVIKQINIDIDNHQALIETLINTTPDLIFFKNTDGVYLGCNKAFEKFAGKSEPEIIGKDDVMLFGSERAAFFRNQDSKMMQSGVPSINEEVCTFPDGKKGFLETLKSPYFDANNNLIGLIGISRDITERKAREEKIQYLSYHDALTGVNNRTFLQEALQRLDSAAYLPLSIIIGDINGMKLINDAFGHSAGDKLLIKTADILKHCSRPNDIIARIGGDEFLILLPNTDAKTANAIAENIRLTCESNQSPDDLIRVCIALGTAAKISTEVPFDDTIAIAEDIMYRRKILETQSLRSSILASIKITMFEKNNETEEHAERLAKLSKTLGKAAGLPEEKMDELELVATLHDIGKISIGKNILSKSGKLTDEDWREIKKHPEVGYRIAFSCPELRHIAEYILYHHERWDGQGYPQGLSGEKIPLISRIITIVDSYDAMTQDRAYRKAMSQEAAMNEIRGNAGTQFDPALAQIFINICGEN